MNKWVVSETFRDDGESEVAAHPFNWISGDVLFWPRVKSKQALLGKLKTCSEPMKSWKKYIQFEILDDGKVFGKLANLFYLFLLIHFFYRHF